MAENQPRAERAVHARSLLAFHAASAAGMPGVFEGGELTGLRVLLCTCPGLAFLTVVTGVDEHTVDVVPALVAELTERGASVGATLATATAASGSASARNLVRAGFTLYERRTWAWSAD